MGIFLRNVRGLIAVLLLLFCLPACTEKDETGQLFIESSVPGFYEIYKISGETPFQFTSEQTGEFNKDVALAPGSYLVLADCSSESVIIYPNQQHRLVSHRVEFIPPHVAEKRDGFSIQCNRSEKTRSRQHISGRFELNVIHGKRDMLVGMVPVHINFEELENPDKPKTLQYQLAALKVEQVTDLSQSFSFFISPQDEMIAATKYQAFGNWDFLLPGKYVVEVNGSRMLVELTAGERRTIQPARLRVTSAEDVDLNTATRITGSPWLIEVNGGHSLNFNETYPILPGRISINISNSAQTAEYDLVEGQSLEIPVKSITVHNRCKQEEIACEGGRSITLSFPEETYPFIESVTDIPILYIDNGRPVQVGIEGSRDVVYEIKSDSRNKQLYTGLVRLIPVIQFKQGQVTDLVRVDGIEPNTKGHTLDLNLEEPTLMPLIAGTYTLAQFIGSSTSEGDRRQSDRRLVIQKGDMQEIEFPVYLSEKKWQLHRKKLQTEETEKELDKNFSRTYPFGGKNGFM
jgi:hypothetical protein